MTNNAWKLIAIMAVSACLLLGFAVLWVGWAFGENLEHIRSSPDICLHGHAQDSVRAAMEFGRLDFISFLLTAGGLLLGVFALIGFWMIRREALDEAARVAAEEARRVSQEFYAKHESQVETRDDNSGLKAYIKGKVASIFSSDQSKSFDPASVSTAGAEEQLEDEKGESDEAAQ
jgi:hypothetical protein